MAWSGFLCAVVILVAPGCLAQCPPGCSCQDKGIPVGYQVTCSNLTKFPSLPTITNTLRIHKSSFTQIIKSSFLNLSELRTVEIEQCAQLAVIDGALFVNLTKFTSFLLYDIPSLTALPNDIFKGAFVLKSVTLENTSIASINGGMFVDNPMLETLKLTNKTVENITSDTFTHISNLTELILMESTLGTIQVGIFQALSKLKSLFISDNMISTIENDAFKGLNNVVQLNLEGNRLIEFGRNVFDGFSNLLELDLSRNSFTKLPIEPFINISSLVSLNMNLNPLTTLGNHSFQGLPNLTYLYLDKMPSLNKIEVRAFEGLGSLDVLSMMDNRGLTTLPGEALGQSSVPMLKDFYLSNNGLTTLDKSIFTDKSNLKRVTIEGNPFDCDCGILGLRMMMDEVGKYPYVESWKSGSLAPLCKSPKRFEQRSVYSLDTLWDLACGKPAIKYRSPLTLTAVEGDSVSLMAQVVSRWSVNNSWINPHGDTLTAPFGSATEKDTLSVTETVLENGTLVCDLSIRKITLMSSGLYRLTTKNKEGVVILAFTVEVSSEKIGGMEQMVIIICTAVGFVLGALLVGIYWKEKRNRETRPFDGEKAGLLANSITRN